MSARPHRPRPDPAILASDIDRRIEAACRLAQTATPGVAEALAETPLMRAAHAVADAMVSGEDMTEAWAAYSAALDQFTEEFRDKMVAYRGATREGERTS